LKSKPINQIIKNFMEEYKRLSNRALITLKLTPKEPLHIGTGAKEFYSPTIKIKSIDNKEYVYIPESSIRGVLRRISESIVKASINAFNGYERKLVEAHYEPEEDIIRHLGVIDIAKEIVQDEDLLKQFIPEDEIGEVVKQIKSGKPPDEMLKKIETLLALLCPICRLWGSIGLRSKIIIRDVLISNYKLHPYTRVSVDRKSQMQAKGRLFSIEKTYIPSIELNIIVTNVKPGSSEALILASLLEYIKNLGISIGGMKSIGLGYLELDTEKSNVVYVDYEKVCLEEKNIDKCLNMLVNPWEYGNKISINEYITFLKKE